MKYRSIYISAFYAFFTSFLSFYLFDGVFDDSYDSFCASMSSFQFTDFSLFDQHYLGILVFRDGLKFIQELFPNINVFSSSYILLNIMSLGYTLHTMDSLILKKRSFVTRHFFFLIVSLLFIENILSITHTRYATVLSGVALINLLYGHGGIKYIGPHFLLFLSGFLMRPESGVGAILIVSVSHFIFRGDFFLLIRRLKLPFLSLLLLVSIFYVHRGLTDRFEILIEPDIEYALSTGRIIALGEMNNNLDSLRYEMASSGMFIDTEFISLKFLKRITSRQFDFNYDQLWSSFSNTLFFYKYYVVFTVFLLLYTILAVFFIRDFSFIYRLLLLAIFQFLLFVYLDYNVRIADRHVIGLNIIFLLLSTFYLAKQLGPLKIPGYLSKLFLFIICLSLYYTLDNALGNQIQVYDDTACLKMAMNEIEKVQKEGNVIVSQNTIHLFDKNYELFNQNNKANKYLMYDVSNYSIVPRNISYLSEICGCDASKAIFFLKWASNNKAVFLIDDQRAALLQKYLRIVHGRSVEFIPIEKSLELVKPLCLKSSVYQSYDLKYLIFD